MLAGPTVSSLTTERTLSTRRTTSSTRRRSASVPTAPVSSTWRLKLVTLTYIWSLAISRMRAPPRSSMPWSSTCAPELRRSVATMPAPTAAAPPTTSGTQAGKAGGQRGACGQRERDASGWMSSSCGTFLFSEQLGIHAVAQAVQREQVDFVDSRRAFVRHADLDIGFAQRAPHGAAGAAGAAAAALPSRATTVMSRACAASTAASTAADWPLALSASSTSPAWPSARTWRAKRSASVASGVSAAGSVVSPGSAIAPSSGRSRSKRPTNCGGELRRQKARDAGAAGQDLAAAGHAGQQRLHGLGNRFAEQRTGLVLEVRAVDEVLLDPLLEHGAG